MVQTHESFGANRRGFTTVELLVVIGVIGLLLGIMIPAVILIQGRMIRSRMTADLRAVAQALEHYHSDHEKTFSQFGNEGYPFFDGQAIAPSGIVGSQLLCLALLAPRSEAEDGYDGLGFRTSTLVGADGKRQGTVYGPYLSADKFAYNPSTYELLDSRGQPILYYAARKTNTLGVSNGGTTRWDVSDDMDPSTGQPKIDIGSLAGKLGLNADGSAPANASPNYTGPFLLWSAGPDSRFGPDAKGKMDDVSSIDP